MKILHVHSELRYAIDAPTTFYFAVAAARTSHQSVLKELLTTSPELPLDFFPFGQEGHQLLRIHAPQGELLLHYDAQVRMDAVIARAKAQLREVPFGKLPPTVLYFTNPSRYCESDKFTTFALAEFGNVDPGLDRVQAICDWVHEHLTYTPNSTDGSTSAADVFIQRTGVCRDYAHLAITLCRALGIPARYVSGYAYLLDPQDFHGFFEAFLDGHWYLFDATRMAPVDGLVRIGVGRDAADVAFATFAGQARFLDKQVTVVPGGEHQSATGQPMPPTEGTAPPAAVSTA